MARVHVVASTKNSLRETGLSFDIPIPQTKKKILIDVSRWFICKDVWPDISERELAHLNFETVYYNDVLSTLVHSTQAYEENNMYYLNSFALKVMTLSNHRRACCGVAKPIHGTIVIFEGIILEN